MSTTEQLFRIGGIYRQQSGHLVRLEAADYANSRWGTTYPGHVFAIAVQVGSSDVRGFVSLMNGRSPWAMDSSEDLNHLLPGELDEQGMPLTKTPVMDRMEAGRALISAKPALDANAAMILRDQRAPVTAAEPSKTDRFPGFTVQKGGTCVHVPKQPTPPGAKVHENPFDKARREQQPPPVKVALSRRWG